MMHSDKQITDLIAEAQTCADAERDALGEEAYVAGLLDRLVAVVEAEHQRAERYRDITRRTELQCQDAEAERDAIRVAIEDAIEHAHECYRSDSVCVDIRILSRTIDTKEKPDA